MDYDATRPTGQAAEKRTRGEEQVEMLDKHESSAGGGAFSFGPTAPQSSKF
jgi:hypothetical protein